jgi:hypothetical protein
MEGNIPYWTVANCWGTDWGDNGEQLSGSLFFLPLISYYSSGFFKIWRGKNEVGIEAGAVAGMPLKY